jgi:hypothetical protein
MERLPKSLMNKKIIGRIDKVDLPEFHLENIACKVDTGAATSAIHCKEVHVVEEAQGRMLYFSLLDPEHEGYNNKTFCTPHFEERLVKSSSGLSELRYVIETPVILFGETHLTQFTLADRERMRFPILLGRRLLRKKFIVDVSRTNLSAKKK